jgi:hypothetical protein
VNWVHLYGFAAGATAIITRKKAGSASGLSGMLMRL